jgi:hypothetical protein
VRIIKARFFFRKLFQQQRTKAFKAFLQKVRYRENECLKARNVYLTNHPEAVVIVIVLVENVCLIKKSWQKTFYFFSVRHLKMICEKRNYGEKVFEFSENILSSWNESIFCVVSFCLCEICGETSNAQIFAYSSSAYFCVLDASTSQPK